MRRTLLALPATGVIFALLVAPLFVLLVYSFWRVESFSITSDWSFDQYRRAVEQYGLLILRTAGIGLLVAAVTTLLALPLAYSCRYKLGRAQDAVVFLLLLALFSGYLVKIYAWKTILGENGILNSALQAVGLIDHPVQLFLFSRFALVVTLVNFLLPLAVLPIYAALQNLPRERIDASHDLGAGRIETTLRLVLPEVAGAVAASFALCFVLAAGDWVTPTLVGGTRSLMVGQVITTQFGAVFDWPFGAALAFSTGIVLLAGVAAAVMIAWLVGRRGSVA